jgi:hypothetical protein
MASAKSPEPVLRELATKIAKNLKQMSEVGATVPDPAGKIAKSLEKGEITFGLAMDDRTLKVTLEWSDIRNSPEEVLADMLFKIMRTA